MSENGLGLLARGSPSQQWPRTREAPAVSLCCVSEEYDIHIFASPMSKSNLAHLKGTHDSPYPDKYS